MNAHEVAEINERRRRMGARSLGDELVELYCSAGASDHAQPYAPMVVDPPLTPRQRDRFRRLWLDAVDLGQRIVVVGPPMRCLMPADRNPFPRFRPFRWLP